MQVAIEPEQVARALDGDHRAMQALVRRLMPVVQMAVGYALLRDARIESRDHQQEVRDFVQEVFIALLDDSGKVLRSWDPERGRSIDSFVRLVARRHVAATLRSGRRSPWTDMLMPGDELERHVSDGRTPATQLESCDTLARVLERLGGRFDERGATLFAMLYVEERSVPEVMDATAMSRDAIYSWRLRFRKLVASLPAEARN